jgi:transcriptional regulator with GAF, ATPase, and Fis domain
VIVAANRDVAEEVRLGRFRADLFFRLNVFPISVPPLRDRHDDLITLARHFVGRFNERLGRSSRGLTREAESMLLRHSWPGNVRELRNTIERAVLLCPEGESIGPGLLPDAIRVRGPTAILGSGSLREQVSAHERELIRAALERRGGVLRRAAIDLRTDPVTLARKARRHALWSGRKKPRRATTISPASRRGHGEGKSDP